MVGYWAENRILGGVVFFDRSAAWDDNSAPERNVYLHSDHAGATFRIWQVLDEQQQMLPDFLLSTPVGACPFPLSSSDKNLTRLIPRTRPTATCTETFGREKNPSHLAGEGVVFGPP